MMHVPLLPLIWTPWWLFCSIAYGNLTRNWNVNGSTRILACYIRYNVIHQPAFQHIFWCTNVGCIERLVLIRVQSDQTSFGLVEWYYCLCVCDQKPEIVVSFVSVGRISLIIQTKDKRRIARKSGQISAFIQ